MVISASISEKKTKSFIQTSWSATRGAARLATTNQLKYNRSTKYLLYTAVFYTLPPWQREIPAAERPNADLKNARSWWSDRTPPFWKWKSAFKKLYSTTEETTVTCCTPQALSARLVLVVRLVDWDGYCYVKMYNMGCALNNICVILISEVLMTVVSRLVVNYVVHFMQ